MLVLIELMTIIRADTALYFQNHAVTNSIYFELQILPTVVGLELSTILL